MSEVSWTDRAFREYVIRVSEPVWMSSISGYDLDAANREFEQQALVRLVPVVQPRLLETIGVAVDPMGLAMIAHDLLVDCQYRENERLWLLATPSPWGYLADWMSSEVSKAYKATAGKKRPTAKALAELERSANSGE